MIKGIVIALAVLAYLVGGLITARCIWLYRIEQGIARPERPDEDDYMACAMAFIGWPVAAGLHYITRPPKLSKQEQIVKLEKELGIK